MKNKIVFLFLLILALGGSSLFVWYSKKSTTPDSSAPVKLESLSAKNATYLIDGHAVTLTNGVSLAPVAPGSSSMVETRYFGNEVLHDFDGDGRVDTAFILTQSTGGSDTFYYFVVALNTSHGYVGTNGFLLGDRISPQVTEMSHSPATGDVIVVNYAERKPGEPFTTQPSIGKSVWLVFDVKTGKLSEVAQPSFGGVGAPHVSLKSKTWEWVSASYGNNKSITPKKAGVFTITFKDDKTFSARTDCNGVGGEYSLSGDKITLSKMTSTLMYCEGSQEADFMTMLSNVDGYFFTSKGWLTLTLGHEGWFMVFK